MGVLLVALVLVVSPVVWGQFDNCAELQQSELGDITAISTVGLLAEALNADSGQSPLSVQLLEFNVVCLAQGTENGTYRSLSLIASYRDAVDAEATTQLHLQCAGGVWSVNNFGSSLSASSPPGGALNTTLRRDCFLCINPAQTAVSDNEHCLACTNCTGSGRCTGTDLNTRTCCNYFGVDVAVSCVMACPADSTPNAEFLCGCNTGFEPSGSNCMDVDECETDPPCQNGGTCTNRMGGFSCNCVPDFTGATCMTALTPCDPTPCQNSGTCTEMENTFSCNCPENWEGTICDDCSLSNCANCTLQSDGTTICTKCDQGFSLSSGNCERTTDDTDIIVGVVIAVLVVITIVVVVVVVIIAIAYKKKKDKEQGKKQELCLTTEKA